MDNPDKAERPVLLNDFGRQWADSGADALAAMNRVGQSGWYVLGKEVAAFEEALAMRFGCAYAVGCASGLDAIEIALRALGIAHGDKVVTSPLSAFATTLAIIRAGGVPVFVDVDESGLIDLALAEAVLTADPSIRFMVPVHLYGHSLDLSRLADIKTRFGVHIVEDCAQAIGARHSGMFAGSVGDAGALSFYPTKNLGALGDGGAAITGVELVARTCRTLRDYGQEAKYVHSALGLNSRLDELHASVLLHAFLPRLDRWTARRRAVAGRYLDAIRSAHVQPLPIPQGSESVWHLFPVLLKTGKRDEFIAGLKAFGIQAAVHYPRLICDQGALRDTPIEVIGELPRAREIAQTEVSLPIHPYLDDTELMRVINAVNAWQ